MTTDNKISTTLAFVAKYRVFVYLHFLTPKGHRESCGLLLHSLDASSAVSTGPVEGKIHLSPCTFPPFDPQ
jgi:hypothetical protein